MKSLCEIIAEAFLLEICTFEMCQFLLAIAWVRRDIFSWFIKESASSSLPAKVSLR